MDVLGPLRRFLDWQRRVFLGEEEWGFPTARDMAGLAQALDQRLRRRATAGDRMVWSSRLRALSVRATAPDRLQVFWNWGYWSPFPRVFGGLYFDGRLFAGSDSARIVGRYRQPVLTGAFLLLVANTVLLCWLVLAVALVMQQVAGCVAYGDYGCIYVARAGVVLGLGALIASLMLAMMRYVIGGAIFSKRRMRVLLSDIAAAGAPAGRVRH